jgi:putative peptidoglycan lipid II flippase
MANELPEVGTNRGLLKPTLQITFFSVIGILVGFVTEIIVAANFGATMARDAYFTAVVVPLYLTDVLLGALTVTFVPIFIEYETKKSKEDAWKVASIFTNLTFLVLFGISLLGFIFAERLISVTAPGFKGVELSLTTSLLRIILPSIVFSGLTSLLSSIYYTEHRFVRPAMGPIINAVLMLICVVLLAPYWGIKSLAFGHLIGSIVGFCVLFPILFKQDRYRFSWDFHNEGVTQIIKVMLPLVFTGIFYRAATVIERMIASTLPTGSISYLGYANKITAILGTIATAGISITIFPVMARGWAENDLAKVREYFARGVRIIMLTTFPIAAVFVVLRVPIIQVVFERGAFDHKVTLAVANVLAILMVTFIAGGLGSVVGKGFYISQRTKLFAILGIPQTLLYFGYAYVLARYFSYIGLAVATSMYYFFPIIINSFLMKRIYHGIHGERILEGFIKILAASLISGFCMYSCFNLMLLKKSLVLQTGISGALGVIVYVTLVICIIKVEEATILKKKIFDKLWGNTSIKSRIQ